MIDTESLSATYRERLIDVDGRRLLMARIAGSAQEADLSEPANARGLGRVRHFRRYGSTRWVSNPLPIDPACARLGMSVCDQLNSEVFQNAACNWRCWYCFVPFDLLAALPQRSEWITARQLVEEYAALPERPPVLDLSGGQPELTPEWVLWTMDALEGVGIDQKVYLWSDDNLSNDYFWRFLTTQQRHRIATYRNYGKVACFKGIDADSFAFNTAADASLFSSQFDLFSRYIKEGIDIYAYVTLTHRGSGPIRDTIRHFIDRLQRVDANLPLRTVPLEVRDFRPVHPRLDDLRRATLTTGQYEALDAWVVEMESRFSPTERATPIHEIRWAQY
jgi:uncharacterized Fe-S cluster-containing radical SAM superfamily protein